MTTDELLMRYLAEREAACPVCKYDVRGLTEPVCPECGDTLILSLRATSPRQGWWIAGLVAWAAGSGLFGILLVMLLPSSSVSLKYEWTLWLGALVSGVGLTLWLVLMRRIRRLRLLLSIALALGSKGAVLVLIVAFYNQVVA